MEIRGDPEGDVIEVRFDTDDADPSLSVAEAVAEIEGKDPTELSTIYGAIDHVIDHLFSDPPSRAADVEVSFSYEGYRITVHQDGNATFVPLSEWEGPIVVED